MHPVLSHGMLCAGNLRVWKQGEIFIRAWAVKLVKLLKTKRITPLSRATSASF
jgi:hypothetical protein